MKHILKTCAVLLLAMASIFAFAACDDEQTSALPDSGTPDASTSTVMTTDKPTSDTPVCEAHTLSANETYCTVCHTVIKKDSEEYKNMIYFNCDDEVLTKAYQIAFADIAGNVHPYKAGVLASQVNCLMAGGDYDTPWTRDASINVWNGYALMNPEVSKNTLLSVLKRVGNGYQIDGQYWDAIIWAIGAYQLINVTHDMEFAAIAENAIANSLKRFEREEYDATDGLFRGPAVYGDGIAAYPDLYAAGAEGSAVLSWPYNPLNKDRVVATGYGIPMKALSTNCIYYQAYVIEAKLSVMLGKDASEYEEKAAAMKSAINKAFWNEEKGTYDYLAYECDYQEAIGLAFVLMFGIADERQTTLVLQNTKVTEQGIAIVYPSFDRYFAYGGYGRHAGVIWPHGQAFWGRACSLKGYSYGYDFELYALAEKAVRDGQFYEIYHPDTGEIYGGYQEQGPGYIGLTGSCRHQTWSATGYLSLIYYEMLGADIGETSVTFKPYLPEGVNEATVSGFRVGSATFEIVITRGGDGASEATFDTTAEGTVRVHLSVQ